MSGQARFCTKCGSAHTEGARFCMKCGEAVVEVAPVTPGPSVTPEPPATPEPSANAEPTSPVPASGEHVHGVIPNATLKEGFLGVKSKVYILVLTERRIVFVRITTEMMKQLVTDSRNEAKADGKGFFGQWGAQLTAYSEFAQRYLTMPPDEALAETPGNFALERSAIVKAKLKAGHTDNDGNTTSDRLIIKATDRKYNIDLGAGRRQAKEALIAAALI